MVDAKVLAEQLQAGMEQAARKAVLGVFGEILAAMGTAPRHEYVQIVNGPFRIKNKGGRPRKVGSKGGRIGRPPKAAR